MRVEFPLLLGTLPQDARHAPLPSSTVVPPTLYEMLNPDEQSLSLMAIV